MNLESFLLMRHELVLTIITLIVLIAELSVNDDNKRKVISIATVLFGINMVVGFLPNMAGILFGKMYVNTDLQWTMKNILNLGVFVVLLQSVEWLKEE